MQETFRRIVGEDLTPLLDKITAQTYIIWGEKDRMTPLTDAHLMHRKIKNSEFVVIPGGSHSPNMDMPEQAAREISKAL